MPKRHTCTFILKEEAPDSCCEGVRSYRFFGLQVSVELQYFSEKVQCVAPPVVLHYCRGAIHDVVAGVEVRLRRSLGLKSFECARQAAAAESGQAWAG